MFSNWEIKLLHILTQRITHHTTRYFIKITMGGKRKSQESCLPDPSGVFLFQAILTFSFLKVPEK